MRMKWMVGAMTLISRSLMSQSLDTLILLDQRIIAKVKEVSPNFVTYVLPGRDVVYSMDKTKLIKICYADRTIEQNPVTKIPGIAYPEDWRNVLISKKPEDIQGLYKLDDVFIMGSLLTNQGKNSLKIIAAMMGGNVVYPTGTDQIANTGYTTSSVRLNGHTSGYVTQPYTSVYTYTTAEVCLYFKTYRFIGVEKTSCASACSNLGYTRQIKRIVQIPDCIPRNTSIGFST